MGYSTHTITLYADANEIEIEAQFWIEAGRAMRDEVYAPGPWVEAELVKGFLGGLELSRAQLVLACGEDGVAAAEDAVAEMMLEDAA